ncbi:SseB protein N-terminal domain [Frankia canadensis]|uniref:SseB protein N-terminal domain n=1 Tax=Frankia canadensis TaxID=1836972 RepID=A0A2I2KZ30_9ACTN|nr:SseB family protein [Frankia canadensis]SNQ50932.1 SseB protein N-terminal domain [Frankia canadensis]SOU58222.1 SseB protein N-terminal domain [Frankia canadensis]
MARHLLTPAGQGDSGGADDTLARVLADGHAAGRMDPVALGEALRQARVFVGVEAQPTSVDVATGADKTSEMALITLRTDAGATALPIFSSVATLAAWRPAARPVPVAAPDAWQEATRLGLGALVIDVAGPCPASLDLVPGGDAEVGAPTAADFDVAALRRPGRDDGPLARAAVLAALRAVPARVEAWPAELPGCGEGDPRPVLVIAVHGVTSESVARQLSRLLAGAEAVAVLAVRPQEARAVRRRLGRGVRATRRRGWSRPAP